MKRNRLTTTRPSLMKGLPLPKPQHIFDKDTIRELVKEPTSVEVSVALRGRHLPFRLRAQMLNSFLGRL
jgi:hypothetical protein